MKFQAGDALRILTGRGGRPFLCAVILAAGCGSRMGAGPTKQMRELCGMPVVVRTLLAYEECPDVKEIVVVARQEEIPDYDGFRLRWGFRKISAVVPGGETRQASCLCGIEAISEKTAYVALADGARALITPEDISRVFAAARRYHAASAATPAVDTVKLADKNGFITSTPERTLTWQAQTPQIFAVNLYRAAAYHAKETGLIATDDNSLVEAIPHPIKLVDCGRENIKITTPSDLTLAESILREREKEKTKKK